MSRWGTTVAERRALLGLVVVAAAAFAVPRLRDEARERYASGFRRHYPHDYKVLKTLLGRSDGKPIAAAHVPNSPAAGPPWKIDLGPEAEAHLQALFDSAYGNDRTGRGIYGPWSPVQYQRMNIWVRGQLSFADESYRVRLKAHGRSPSGHVADGRMSLALKMRDGRQLWGARRLNLIVGPRRHAHYEPIRWVATRLGLLVQRDRAVDVTIGEDAPYRYYAENRLDDREMEARGMANLHIFRPNESSGIEYRSHIGPVRDDLLRKSLRPLIKSRGFPSEGVDAIEAVYRSVNRGLRKGDPDAVVRGFNQPYMVQFEALRRLMGFTGHGYRSHNLFAFYDQANGKLLPIVTRDHMPSALGGNQPEHVLNIEQRQRLPDVVLPIARQLSRHDGLRSAVYRRLQQLIDDPEVTAHMPEAAKPNVAFWRAHLGRMAPRAKIAAADAGFTLELRPGADAPLRVVAWRVPVETDAAEVDVSIALRSDDPMVRPRALRVRAAVKDGAIDLAPVLADVRFLDGLGPECRRLGRTYRLAARLADAKPNVDAITMQLLNVATAKRVDAPVETVATLAPVDEVPASPAPLDALRRAHPELPMQLRDGVLEVGPGKHRIARDFAAPMKLRLVAGTTLSLAPDVVLHARGLDVEGTAEAPVRIVAADPKRPYGSVAIAGGPAVDSTIRYLVTEGGRDRWFDGAFYSGGVSIHYNRRVVIEHSRFARHRGDDGLNVKFGTVALSDNIFDRNRADQIDLDSCTGVVERSTFIGDPEGEGGDGLDVSASEVLVRDATFRDLSDKGVSVGEASTVWITNGSFAKSPIGIAAKDRSVVVVEKGRFEGLGTALTGYRKKKIFGGGSLLLIDSPVPATEAKLADGSTAESAPAWIVAMRQDVTKEPGAALARLRHKLKRHRAWSWPVRDVARGRKESPVPFQSSK